MLRAIKIRIKITIKITIKSKRGAGLVCYTEALFVFVEFAVYDECIGLIVV